MTETIYYAAMRDDRVLAGTISTNSQKTYDLAYDQAYNDASDDLADQKKLDYDTDVESYMRDFWYYTVQKFTKATLLAAIANTQANYCDFSDFTAADLDFIQNQK